MRTHDKATFGFAVDNDGGKLDIFARSDIKPAVGQFANGLNRYLESIGLPSDNVLVNEYERMRVFSNLPDVVDRLPSNRRKDAYYISKYVAACGAGLFDAALNYVWSDFSQPVNGFSERQRPETCVKA